MLTGVGVLVTGAISMSSLAERDRSHARAAASGDPRSVHHYDPDQPRVPAGRHDGGQWTSVGGSQPEATRRWLEIFELAAADSWRAAVAVPHIPRPGYTPLASAFLPFGTIQLASQRRFPGQRIPGVTDPLEGGGGGGRVSGGSSTSGGPGLSARRAEQLKINKAAGAKFENSTGAKFEQQKLVIGGQVTVKTPGGTRYRADFVTHNPETGLIRCVECKASPTARTTPNQVKAFREIEKSGATVVGKGKPEFPGGTKVPAGPVDIIRGP